MTIPIPLLLLAIAGAASLGAAAAISRSQKNGDGWDKKAKDPRQGQPIDHQNSTRWQEAPDGSKMKVTDYGHILKTERISNEGYPHHHDITLVHKETGQVKETSVYREGKGKELK